MVDYCLQEGILQAGVVPLLRAANTNQAANPSLRYLELQLTDRCNLRCRHCFLGDTPQRDMSLKTFKLIVDQFQAFQGLKLILTGGEPLLHSHFWEINDKLSEYDLRMVLLSNGHLIDSKTAQALKVHEVQLSIDGLEQGHDALRGRGSFRRVVKALENLLAAGKKVSVATMIHTENLNDFPQIAQMIEEWGVEEWNVDLPSPTGRLGQNKSFLVDPQKAAPLMDYGKNGGHFNASGPWTCGAHLATATIDGYLIKCSFYEHQGEPIQHCGLRKAWAELPRMTLKELDCQCLYLEQCRGGCRFRADTLGNPKGPDLVQCYRCGVL